jgi:transposase
LPRENTNAKHRVRSNSRILNLDNSMCHKECKIQEHFTDKSMTRVFHLVYSPHLSPSEFWFFRYAKKQMNYQAITDEDDLRYKLTDVWQLVCVGSFNHCSMSWLQDWNGW